MRARARSSFRALCLVIILLASTQLILLTTRDYTQKELATTPQRFEADNSEVAIVSLGESHACAIGTLDQMKCWGDGEYGKTGHENTADYGDEEKEMGLYLMFADVGSGLTFTDVAAGDRFTCGLLNDATVKCWGRNAHLGSAAGEIGSGSRGDGYLEMGASTSRVYIGDWNATAITAGDLHACAIVNDSSSDELICWGDNTHGQLGLGNTDWIGDTETDVSSGSLPQADLPDRSQGISQVSAGNSHTCVLWDDGEMACWGDNTYGQLGVGSTDTIGDGGSEMGNNLVLVDFPAGRTATQISAGEDMTCAVLDNGGLTCWGRGSHGRLGSESTANIGGTSGEMGDNLETVDLGSGLSVESVKVGHGSSCAILDYVAIETPHIVKCWGAGASGALGLGDANNRGDLQFSMGNNLETLDMGSGLYATSLDVGESFACAVLNNTMLKCWGAGVDGRTGLGKSRATG